VPEGEAEETTEPRQMSERTAKVILLVIAVGAMWGLVAVAPWVAYVVVGVFGTLGWQKARGWLAQRWGSRGDPSGPSDQVTLEDVVETLHAVANPNAFLADFAAAFDLDTAAGRALLEGHTIRVRRAVRNGETTGVGVHRDDVPPLPHPLSDPPERGVDLHNQRPTVEAIGLAGVVVKDGSEVGRRHRIQ